METKKGSVGGSWRGWWGLAIVVGLAVAVGIPVSAGAQEPVDCDGLNIELVDLFANPICYKSRFRGSGTIGSSESIHGETRDYLINFQFARSGSGYTYLSSIDFEVLMNHYGLSKGLDILGPERDARDGFSYVSVGGPGLDSCILFLKQSRPIRNGYRAQYFGIACDKRRQGEYGEEDAIALLDLIKNY